ncbi:hypothetical protein [Providencia hangzhouensis]
MEFSKYDYQVSFDYRDEWVNFYL